MLCLDYRDYFHKFAHNVNKYNFVTDENLLRYRCEEMDRGMNREIEEPSSNSN